MAILSTLNLLSEQRLGVDDVRRIESAVRNDFDTLTTAIITGTSQGYIIRGFSIVVGGSIGSPANGLAMKVDPGAVLHIAASVSGTIFQTPLGTIDQTLNAATNPNVTGSFTANSTNYVGIDYNRFADPTTNTTKYIWNVSANDEITTIAPAAQTLTFKIIITTSVWAANVLPVAIVTTDSNGNVISITDARWMLYSLSTGGLNPNSNSPYPWSAGRTQVPVTTTSDAVNPFTGGDKQLGDLKDWMNAIMSEIGAIKGTPEWFSSLGPLSMQGLLQDLGNTVITGSGEISNGILPNSDSILVTTGTITSSSNIATGIVSVAGLSNGDFVFGTGIPGGTTILNIAGSGPYTITMSKEATLNGSGIGFTFYNPSVITAPGQINWDQPIFIRVIGSSLTYELAANPSSTDITLANDEVAYITLGNDQPISPNLIFVSGSKVVTSVGSVAWTSGLLPGDFIKIATNTSAGYYQIAPVGDITYPSGGIINSFTVGLATVVSVGDNTGVLGAQAQHAFNSYSAAPTPSTPRNIFISPRADVPAGAFWLFLREDNGGAPRVYIRFLAQELDNGESVQVSGTTSLELLQYIGSLSASDSFPQYVSAMNPGSVSQITNIVVGSGATVTAGQYFLINSSANSQQYAVWFKVDGVGVVPVVPNVNNYIEVDILSTDSVAQVASKLNIALAGSIPGDFTSAINNEYIFTTSPANATVGATYSNNSQTFTVVSTISGGITLATTGTGAPALSGSPSLLASAASYGILAASAITNSVGTSTVNGNLGEYAGSTVTGAFTVTGATNLGNGAANTAQNDALSAYTSLAAHGGYVTIANDLGIVGTLSTGYYTFAAGDVHLAQSGPQTLTLNGSATDVFVFKTPSTLTTGAGGMPTITLTGGAIPENVYWVVGSSATINSGTAGTFNGNIIAQASVTDTMGGVVNGSLIALTAAVTLSQVATINAQAGASGTLTKISGTGDATITFSAFVLSPTVMVTNTSAGTSISASNFNVGTPFAISTARLGTGIGNYVIHDGDSLTLAIKELDLALGNLFASLNSPSYDEALEIVVSGGTYSTVPASLNGPVANGAFITLPNNSREGNLPQQYTVGKGSLMVFLNGQFIDLESGAYVEVGPAGTPSTQIQIIDFPSGGLVVFDELEFRLSGGGGGGGGGGIGPAGPAGSVGPAGANGLGNMQAISTKVGPTTYGVLTGDQFLLANCASGAVTFDLPIASTVPGRCFYFKKTDASSNYMFIVAAGGDLIDGFGMQSTNTQYEEFAVVSSSSAWWVF